jgi:hypothetical protein
MKVVVSSWNDSLFVPMIALPVIAVATCTIMFYVKQNHGAGGCHQYTKSSNVEISNYLCCFPEYYVGLICLSGAGACGIAAAGQV